MRLELEPISAVYTASPALSTNTVDEIIERGVAAAREGNRSEARVLLQRAVEMDSNSEAGWLWLASVSDYPEELLVFLDHVLRVNPENRRAKEWKGATQTLLAKTFVQRGVDAANNSQPDYALHCFEEALKYDEQNQTAWFWVSSLKDPEPSSNEANQPADIEVRIVDGPPAVDELLDEAKSAAAAGDPQTALQLLEKIVEIDPKNEQAWMFRANLADSLEEKLSVYERILGFDPQNAIALAGCESISSILNTSASSFAEQPVYHISHSEPMILRPLMATESHDGPTQELELPAAILESNPFESYAEQASAPELDDFPRVEYPSVAPPEVAAYEFPDTPISEQAARVVHEALGVPADDSSSEVDTEAEEIFTSQSIQNDYPETNSDRGEFLVQPDAEELVINAAAAESMESSCPFCRSTISDPAILCVNCGAMLTMSDIDAVLAHRIPEPSQLRNAVDRMELARHQHQLAADGLLDLALGHLNLNDMASAHLCLQEAAALTPNDVLVGNQLNTLAIRMDEIENRAARPVISGQKTILVVDDSATVRKLISGKLEKGGHEVFCAEDGMQAMELLQNLRPDLILLDIAMPRMDGYQACKQIRLNDATKDVPVIMISGKDGFFDKMRGKMAGCTDYITKPFGPEALMKALGTYLQNADELAGIQ